MSCPTNAMCFLKGTIHHGFTFLKSSPLHISTFYDSYWTSNIDDKHSTSAYCVFLSYSIISWHTSKQSVISHSSIVLEYRAIASAISKLLWLRSIFITILNQSFNYRMYCLFDLFPTPICLYTAILIHS